MAGRKRKRSHPFEEQRTRFTRLDTLSIVSQRRANCDLQCTASDSFTCQIVNNLTVWNEFLWIVNAELKEISPGKLALLSLKGDVMLPFVLTQRRRYVCYLIYVLLKEHRCIEAVELNHTVIPDEPSLFCDALRASRGLRHLKLRNYRLCEDISSMLMKAVGSVAALETLELGGMRMYGGSQSVLRCVVTRATSLKVLSLTNIAAAPNDALWLVECIRSKPTLQVLHVDDNLLLHGNGALLGTLLEKNSKIKEFSITHRHTGLGVITLIRALEKNSTLTKMVFINFVLTVHEVVTLSRVLQVNTSLQTLQITFSGGVAVSEFAQVIRETKGLVELILDGACVHAESILAYAEALESNSSLKKLGFPNCSLKVPDAAVLVRAMTACALVKLELGTLTTTDTKEILTDLPTITACKDAEWALCFDNVPVLLQALKAGFRMPSISLKTNVDVDYPLLRRLFGELSGCLFLRELHLTLCVPLNEELFTPLSKLLATSKNLKHLSLNFVANRSVVCSLLNGLQLNSSLCKLSLKGWNFYTAEARMLELILKTNKTLTHLSFEPHISGTSCCLVTALASCLNTNYTLLTVDTPVDCCIDRETFAVRDALRRNLTFLHGALKFVLGSNEKRHAAAFEKVRTSDALLKEVMKLTKSGETEAVHRIMRRTTYLRVHFFVIVGVVKRQLECAKPRMGAMTLGQLNLDCLEKIASYLTIADVPDA